MEIKTNGDWNPCQLNETINLSSDGKILSKSLMLNLRGEKPQDVWKTYQELKGLIDGREGEPGKKAKRSKKEAQKGNEQSEEEQKKSETCPECGGILIEKSGISSKNGRPFHFWGCSNWPICNFTRPFLTGQEKKRLESVPCDQDLPVVPF